MEAELGAPRMIGCRNCQGVVPMQSRFCPRCGHVMSSAPPKTESANESPQAQRIRIDKEIESEVERQTHEVTISGIWFVLLIVGGLIVVSGINPAIAAILLLLAVIGFVVDVYRNVKIRERVEREVRARFSGSANKR